MPRRPSPARRLATAARWPLGVTLTSWRYMWRTTPMTRIEEPGGPEDKRLPELGPEVSRDDLQPPGEGAGPLYHRLYEARINDPKLSAERLIECLREDPNRASPSEFAHFQKVHGGDGPMRANDEYVVRMPGPWDGPVRVVAVEPLSFRLATLRSHLEAGQIRFSAEPVGDHCIVFRIESWARSGDRLSNLLYTRVRMAKEVQLHMWTSFLERVIDLSGGARSGRLGIHTRRVDDGG